MTTGNVQVKIPSKAPLFHRMNSANLPPNSFQQEMVINQCDNTMDSETLCFSQSQNSFMTNLTKSKLKKDANEHVDPVKEFQMDQKYKTELCKSFTENGFCAYGNKCRFAHGRNELFVKPATSKKYKLKECLSFFKQSYCCYGSRCNFKHEERKFFELPRSANALALMKITAQAKTQEEVFNMSEQELVNLVYCSKPRQNLNFSNFLFNCVNFQKDDLKIKQFRKVTNFEKNLLTNCNFLMKQF
jgi:hypothetical protein